MPIIGVIASSTRQGLVIGNAFDSIQTYSIGSGGQSVVTFSGIPNTYKHLQIRYLARSGRSRVANSGLVMRINGAYGTYSHGLIADGASVTAGGGVPTINGLFLNATGTSASSGFFGAGIIDILDYATGTKNPVVRAFSGTDCNGSGLLYFNSQFVDSTTAVSSISFETVDGGTNIQQYSHFALYGIKG